jgi:hypothetical protein
VSCGTSPIPDVPHHRLFVGRQNRLMVVDENDGRLIGEVTGIHGAHGAAIVETTGHGFATSSDDSSIVMFDLGTVKVLGKRTRLRTPTPRRPPILPGSFSILVIERNS